MSSGILCNIGIPTISKYDIERYITKPIQLIEAEKIGFKIPETYITNSFQDINSLKEKIIFGKTVKHHNIEIIPNLLVHVYGRSFVPSQICKDDFQLTPTIIQNLLNIKREVRITFFGDRLFGTEYQNVEMEDWHDQGIYGFSMRGYQVENDLREKIYKLMSNLHLKLGTIDLVNVNDEWYFLEVNPNGDWRWIESQSNQRMSMACIDFLKETLEICYK